MKRHSPVVLITGCSSGIGAALCREFRNAGCAVVASARRLESVEELSGAGFEALQLDVNEQADIERVVQSVTDRHGRIDMLVNNAGYGLVAPAVDLSLSDLRAQFETNVFAPIAMAQAVAPAMKSQGTGKIVNIGSVSGVTATPFGGAYCASKAALHLLNDSLRMELAPFGIHVVNVQAGSVISGFGRAAARIAQAALKPDSWYASMHQVIEQRAQISQRNGMPAAKFARSVVTAVLEPEPPPIVRAGNGAWKFVAMRRCLPTRIFDRLMTRRFKLDALSGSKTATP